MINEVIKGDGSSRFVKAKTMPNTYADFKSSILDGDLTVDLTLNPDGVSTQGTPLTASNLLKPATATKLGLTPPSQATVDDAISKLADGVQHKTAEHIVGTWTDGSPIYSKTVQTTITPSTSGVAVTIDSDVKVTNSILINSYGIIKEGTDLHSTGTNQYQIPMYTTYSATRQVEPSLNSSGFVLYVKWNNSSTCTVIITYEYVKTS